MTERSETFSFSTPSTVVRGQVSFWPKGFNIEAYKQIFSNKQLIVGYRNSILYTVVGTCVNIIMTVLAAYPLSVKDFVGRKFFTSLFIFVMVFTAPLIPVISVCSKAFCKRCYDRFCERIRR